MRLLFFVFLAIIYFPVAALIGLVTPTIHNRRKFISEYCTFISKLILWSAGIKLSVTYKFAESRTIKGLLVSNHLSYMDIFIISSQFPGCFVTSIELKQSIGLGEISKMAACVFVERRSRGNLSQEIIDMTNTLKHNVRVLLFPESVTSNGDAVLRFKRPLFQAAIDSQQKVQPVTIHYEVSKAERDQVLWYGDMTFFAHFYNFLSRPRTEVSLTIHEPVSSKGHDITTLSEKCQQIVSSEYKPIA